MRSRIAVLASGGGSNLQAILDYFSSKGEQRSADVVAVISDRTGAFALERARSSDIEAVVLPYADHGALEETLVSRDVDLVVLAGYLRLLPPSVIHRFRHRIVNIHPGPLPRFGGPGMYGERVHAAVIAAGIRESAVTVHAVEEEYDSGAILAQWPVSIMDGDTPESLSRRVLEVEHILYPRVIELVLALLASNTITTS
ncbi:MAG: phosphoribosylglycinamide formyltransferase [Gemmatimonadaceae bacterium]|nr:phosphoribosylglycinamide formyltransferase [Gemmatimonadaceae bacterium]